MNKRRLQRAVLLMASVGLLFAGACGLWLRSRQRQAALNRHLLAAVVKYDYRQALALVNAGADPNTPYKPLPAPSLKQLWDYLYHRSVLPVNDNPTAFMIACGWCWWDENGSIVALKGPDAPQLVQTMLEHGADLNMKDHDGWTPLMGAASANHPKTIGVLLDHGVNINAKAQNGCTALLAVAPNGPPDIIRQLVTHGADPNLAANDGTTALQLAQAAGRLDLMAVLRKAGAKR
jgi:ankyrin repeat protein